MKYNDLGRSEPINGLLPKPTFSGLTLLLFTFPQVNKILKDLVKSAVNPETDEIETLSKSVDGFTCALVDPLRSDSDTRNTFKSCFDSVVDKAIDTEQKEVTTGIY